MNSRRLTRNGRVLATVLRMVLVVWCAAGAVLRTVGDEIGRSDGRSSGNRWVSGFGDLRSLAYRDIPLSASPRWIVAVPRGAGMLWTAVLKDGRVQQFQVTDSTIVEVPAEPAEVPGVMPPLVAVTGLNEDGRVVLPDSDFSNLTHPVILPKSKGLAWIDSDGHVVLRRDGNLDVIPVNALPDARILVDHRDRILVITDPTDRYPDFADSAS